MKRIVFLLLGMMAVLPAFAQPNRDKWAFKPKDTWPFLYEDFTEGVVCSDSGDDILTGKINVSVLNQKLYYIKGENIMEADMVKVFSVKAGEDIFVNVAGKLYKVLAESKGGAAVQARYLDVEQMNKANIGYGVSSSVASTQNVAGLALDSNAGTNINKALESKEGGAEIPLAEKTYILFCRNRIVPALKREVMDVPGLDKNQAKAFFKEHKIKWSQPESLTEVADFLTENLLSNHEGQIDSLRMGPGAFPPGWLPTGNGNGKRTCNTRQRGGKGT